VFLSAELMLGRPLFAGRSDLDQLTKVFQQMGSPPASAFQVQPPSFMNLGIYMFSICSLYLLSPKCLFYLGTV
jgi:hypothetical protein